MFELIKRTATLGESNSILVVGPRSSGKTMVRIFFSTLYLHNTHILRIVFFHVKYSQVEIVSPMRFSFGRKLIYISRVSWNEPERNKAKSYLQGDCILNMFDAMLL